MGYVRHLQQNMLTHVKTSESASLDPFLITLQTSITHDLDINFSRRQPVHDPPKYVDPKGGLRDNKGLGKGKDRQGKPKAPQGTSVPKRSSEKKPYICFYHHPKAGLVCKSGTSCVNRHLDASYSNLHARWTNVASDFNKRNPSKAINIPRAE